MDSFEHILEQLKQAQSQGQDAVTGKIEAIAEKLSSLVDEATASVRETLSREADELFPVADLRAALEDFNRRADEAAEENALLVQRLQAAEERLDGAEASAGGITLELLRGLDRARSQSQLLRELLPALCSSVARAAILVIRGGDVNAWSGIGFADGEQLREWRCGTADSPSLARLVADERPVSFKPGQDPVFEGWLEREAVAEEALLVPVCLRSQLMGCVYVDNAGEGPWDPDAVQGLVAVACWMIDTLHARQTVPAPMLAEVLLLAEELPGDGAIEDEQVVFDMPPQEDAVEEALIEEPPQDDEMAPADEAPPEIEPEFEPEDEPEPEAAVTDEGPDDTDIPAHDEYDPSATMRVEVAPEIEAMETPVHEQETLVDEEPPAVPEEEEEAPEQETAAPAQPVTPPPPIEAEEISEPPATDLSPEEAAQHEEARRFARLLISEIKLYNEEEVERGRAARDIYPRLREDIDRSREMYEKRISEEVRQVTDYFDQELIRILAEGDSDALGM